VSDGGGDIGVRGHTNMAERFRVGVGAAGGEVVDGPGWLLWAPADEAFPVFANGALVLAAGAAEAMLPAATEFFDERGRGFTVIANGPLEADDLAPALGEHGFFCMMERYPAMVRTSRFADPVLPDGIELRRMTRAEEVPDYHAVLDAAYLSLGFPAGVLANLLPPDSFLRPDVAAFIAYSGQEPVAAGMTHVSHGIAGITWIGTLEQHRRHGLGQVCAAAAANAGFDLGADAAWLEASPMGESVYRGMGFEELFPYSLWVHPPPA
jgi:ribosomal protein S18 acetylase RimI-like enzyme